MYIYIHKNKYMYIYIYTHTQQQKMPAHTRLAFFEANVENTLSLWSRPFSTHFQNVKGEEKKGGGGGGGGATP